MDCVYPVVYAFSIFFNNTVNSFISKKKFKNEKAFGEVGELFNIVDAAITIAYPGYDSWMNNVNEEKPKIYDIIFPENLGSMEAEIVNCVYRMHLDFFKFFLCSITLEHAFYNDIIITMRTLDKKFKNF